MRIIDLYDGFEGEMEVFLMEKTITCEAVFQVHLYYGHFYTIMDLIPFAAGFDVDNVIYNWHVNLDWGEDKESECKRLQEFYNQILLIDSNVTSDYRDAYNAIMQICQSTLSNGNQLYYLTT